MGLRGRGVCRVTASGAVLSVAMVAAMALCAGAATAEEKEKEPVAIF